MRFRITFLLVAAFFVLMNVLLWRSEYGGRGQFEAEVPAELVWEKVLTSPDNSFLEIRHHGVKLGRAHWSATVGEALATGRVLEEMPPEGMVRSLTGYTIDFDGTIVLDQASRLRFTCHLALDEEKTWKTLEIKLAIKPESWTLLVTNADASITVITDDGAQHTRRTFTEADLRNPATIARDFGGEMWPAALAALGVPLRLPAASAEALRFKWVAANDRVKIGNNLVRAYRLETRLFERFKAVLFVSPVGELLRVDLPDEITLINDALLNL